MLGWFVFGLCRDGSMLSTRSIPSMTRFLLQATVFALLVGALPLTMQGADAPGVPLKKGDKIVFLGDSITQGGGGPKGYITLIQKALDDKHKDLGITTVNA